MHKIRPLTLKDNENFFSYLDKQLLNNGKNDSPLFIPMSREQSRFPNEKKQRFIDGLAIPVGSRGWRRAWFMLDDYEQICAHVDLCGLHEPYTEHRCLLGLGVLKGSQGKGIGEHLTNYAIEWAQSNETIEIIDLAVLSLNVPAIKLYEKLGFEKLCEVKDMFRIDGRSESHYMMSKVL